MGIDATNKWQGETQREWGVPIKKDPKVVKRIDEILAKRFWLNKIHQMNKVR